MTEQEVWPLATEIWEKRKKLPYEIHHLRIMNFYIGYRIDVICGGNYSRFFDEKDQVRRFLDGLEKR